MRRFAAIVLLVIAAAASSAAQTPACASAPLPVNVLGLPPERASALTPGNFRVFLDGHPTRIDTMQYGEFPHTTYVLLDASGSMTASGYWQLANEFAFAIVKKSSEGEVKIAAFDSKISQFIDRSELMARGMPPFQKLLELDSKTHKTALFDAIAHALRVMPHVAPEDTIVVLTDGGDNASRTKDSDVLEVMRAVRVRLLVISVRDYGIPDVNAEELNSRGDVSELAAKTGGAIFDALPPLSERRLFRYDLPSPDGAQRDKYIAKLIAWYTALQTGFRLQLPAVAKRTKVKVELTPKIADTAVFYPSEIRPCERQNR